MINNISLPCTCSYIETAVSKILVFVVLVQDFFGKRFFVAYYYNTLVRVEITNQAWLVFA